MIIYLFCMRFKKLYNANFEFYWIMDFYEDLLKIVLFETVKIILTVRF